MVKADIIEKVNERTGLSKKECSSIVESVFGIMKDTLEAGEEVKLSGFGVFKVKSKNERMGRNPHTGEQLTLAPRRILTWKASMVLKQTINKI